MQNDMKLVGGVWLPKHETHLVDWMKKMNQVVEGKLSYQLDKRNLALKYVKNFRTAVDVGGHCGLWSMDLAKRFEQLHAFEPVALHRACFEKNVIGDNVTLHVRQAQGISLGIRYLMERVGFIFLVLLQLFPFQPPNFL